MASSKNDVLEQIASNFGQSTLLYPFNGPYLNPQIDSICSHYALATIFKDYICPKTLQDVKLTALTQQVSVFHILLTRNIITNANLIKALADYFNINIYQGADLKAIAGLEPQLDTIIRKKRYVRATSNNAAKDNRTIFTVLEPQFLTLEQISTQVILSQKCNIPLVLTDQEHFQAIIENRYHSHFTQQALYNLRDHFKDASACTLSPARFLKAHKIILYLFALSILIGTFFFFKFFILLLYGFGLLLTPLFIAVISLRLWAIIHFWKKSAAPMPRTQKMARLPTYTILVPLYREEKILPSLTKALMALDYPKEKLDIKLLLEADDLETQHTAKNLKLPCYFQCLIVPHSFPKTKPKALNYALNFALGDYVVIYDAEDRPDKDQLHKALQKFSQDSDSLACVQARLNTYNGNTNWLTQQFTLEYSALFNALLPALSHLNLPFLLGGTSNHFKMEALKKVGGWDAFNVTEDADLGIRLYRLGYRCSTINSTTHEESCTHFSSWIKQRSRWLKGWMQTYCVHMSNPLTLWKQLGWKGFACFQVLLGGQILASLSYLFFLLIIVFSILSTLLLTPPLFAYSKVFLTFSSTLFLLSYLINLWLNYLTAPKTKSTDLGWALISTPFYWAMISAAAFRALSQLFTKPFYWEKTEHGHSLTDQDHQN